MSPSIASIVLTSPHRDDVNCGNVALSARFAICEKEPTDATLFRSIAR